MNRHDLGQYFIKNGEIYYCLGYIENPALEIKNIRTGQKEVIVIGSLVSKEYSKLYSIPCDENYILDKAEPVKNIKFD